MKQNRFSVRDMVVLSLLVSLNVVLSRIASIRIPIGGVESLRIGFGAMPVIFAGLFFGARAGATVGTLGDIAGFIMSPAGGVFMPHFTLSVALAGAIPPLVLRLFGRKEYVTDYSLLELLVAIGVGQTVTSVLLTPYFLDMLFGVPFAATVFVRIQTQLVQVPIYAVFLKLLARRLSFLALQ
ncbi:MAG: folate family ECF transporter S component [Synergistaceae bacterium]|nr:folate family ECF transporter S component [Synergistota bacterium]NLM71272.1 folate family ECF transporter S component [Synergistaceae bacterium]